MGIHPDGFLVEGIAQQDVGRLSPDSGKGRQIIQVVGDLTAKTLNDTTAAVLNEACLVAIKIDFSDLFFEFYQRAFGIVLGVFKPGKERRCYLIDPFIPGLGGQYEGNEKLQGGREIEIQFCIRMDALEDSKDLCHLLFVR